MDNTKNTNNKEYDVSDNEAISNNYWINRLISWWSGLYRKSLF